MASTTTGDARFSFQYTDDQGKQKRVTGLLPAEVGKLFGASNGKVEAAVKELLSRPTSNGSGSRDDSPEAKAARKAYNERRRATMTPEQKAVQAAKRKAYNAKRNAEMREAMKLLREHQHSNGATSAK